MCVVYVEGRQHQRSSNDHNNQIPSIHPPEIDHAQGAALRLGHYQPAREGSKARGLGKGGFGGELGFFWGLFFYDWLGWWACQTFI